MKLSPGRVYFFEFVWSSAAFGPLASLAASSFAQKCMKNSRGTPSACGCEALLPESRYRAVPA